MRDRIPMTVQPKGDSDAMVEPMIQTPKATIPAEINNESALSICVPFQAGKRPPTEVASSKCLVLHYGLCAAMFGPIAVLS